ncbi:deoxyribose-phosphate aldolase [Bacteroidota bacterium]
MNNANSFNENDLSKALEQINSQGKIGSSLDNLKLIFSLIDLTSLNTEDTVGKIRTMCVRVSEFSDHYPDIPNLGAICVYPSMVPVVKDNLKAPGVGIASVAAGFPSSQTFMPVKEMESRLAVEAGATEIDIVISVGRYLEDDMEYIAEEIRGIKSIIAPSKLKVILETGLLSGAEAIYNASMVSMRAGADFIKTSTGKVQPAASPEAVLVMCHAIKAYFKETGIKTGIKPAGGISTPEQALAYASIVQAILGKEWLDPSLFRIGASRLANGILSEISHIKTGETSDVNYF